MAQEPRSEIIYPLPPKNAFVLCMQAIGELSDRVRTRKDDSTFPSGTSQVNKSSNMLASMHRDDHRTTTPKIPEPGLRGMAAMLEGLHTHIRRHPLVIHDAYIDEVLEQATRIPATMETGPLRTYAALLEGAIKHAHGEIAVDGSVTLPKPASKELKGLGEHYQQVQQYLQPGYVFTMADRIRLLLDSARMSKAITSTEKTYDSLNGRAFVAAFSKEASLPLSQAIGDLGKDMRAFGPLTLTLHDALGRKSATVVLPDVVHLAKGKQVSTAGLIVACAASSGFADSAHFPGVWSHFVMEETLGSAYQIPYRLDKLLKVVRKNLEAQGKLKPKDIEQILCASHFNLSPKTWHDMRAPIERHIQKSALADYVISLGEEIDEKADYPVAKELLPLEYMQGMCKKMGVEIPKPDTLVPSTRYDYHGLLHAMMIRLDVILESVNEPVDTSVSKEYDNLAKSISTFNSRLLNGGKPSLEAPLEIYAQKSHPVQKPASKDELERIKQFADRIELLRNKIPYEGHSADALDILLGITKRGLEGHQQSQTISK